MTSFRAIFYVFQCKVYFYLLMLVQKVSRRRTLVLQSVVMTNGCLQTFYYCFWYTCTMFMCCFGAHITWQKCWDLHCILPISRHFLLSTGYSCLCKKKNYSVVNKLCIQFPPPTCCQIMYQEVCYIQYTYLRFTSQLWLDSDSQKIQPPPKFSLFKHCKFSADNTLGHFHLYHQNVSLGPAVALDGPANQRQEPQQDPGKHSCGASLGRKF